MEQLEAQYCPPLDAALFAAIASDYDLDNDAQRRALVDILGKLKEESLLVQAAEDEEQHAKHANKQKSKTVSLKPCHGDFALSQ
jgi:hypothetical protein